MPQGKKSGRSTATPQQNADAEVVAGDVVDVDDPQPGSEVVRMPDQPPPAAVLAGTPQVQASELVKRLDVIREASENAMKEGVDFGKVPGTDKPTLLKPGAEKLGVLFQLDIQLANTKQWGPGDHLTVISQAHVFHAPTG